MENGKIENGLNKGLWMVMNGFSHDVSENPTNATPREKVSLP